MMIVALAGCFDFRLSVTGNSKQSAHVAMSISTFSRAGAPAPHKQTDALLSCECSGAPSANSLIISWRAGLSAPTCSGGDIALFGGVIARLPALRSNLPGSYGLGESFKAIAS